MSDLFVYSPQQVILTIAGYQFTGWQSIRIAKNTQGFQPIRGIRGKNTRVRNLDTSATITLPLLQTSQGNDVLSSIHADDLLNGTGRLTLTLKDMSGQSVFSSDEGYITGYPETVYAGEISYRSWNIYLQSTKTYKVGGNASAQSSLFDSALGQAANIITDLFN